MVSTARRPGCGTPLLRTPRITSTRSTDARGRPILASRRRFATSNSVALLAALSSRTRPSSFCFTKVSELQPFLLAASLSLLPTRSPQPQPQWAPEPLLLALVYFLLFPFLRLVRYWCNSRPRTA